MPEIGGPLYLFLKVLHLVGWVGFLGGLVMALYWKVSADRSGDPAFVARVHDRIRKMDKHIIGPGAFATFAAGYLMVRGFGRRIGETPFALWGLILMFVALAIWFFPMRKLAESLRKESEVTAAARGAVLGPKFGANSILWLACGFLAASLVVLVAIMMVYRFPGG